MARTGGMCMNSYRLAICEDDPLVRDEMCALCRDILTEEQIEHEVTPFSSAEELEKILAESEHPFDLLLLDIQMEGMNGLELAQNLRKKRRQGQYSVRYRLRELRSGRLQRTARPFSFKAGEERGARRCAAY